MHVKLSTVFILFNNNCYFVTQYVIEVSCWRNAAVFMDSGTISFVFPCSEFIHHGKYFVGESSRIVYIFIYYCRISYHYLAIFLVQNENISKFHL